MALGELHLVGNAHSEAVGLFVSICRTYFDAEQNGSPPGTRLRQTVYRPDNPPGERGELYLFELEMASMVKVTRIPRDSETGVSYIPTPDLDGATTVVEPTEEAYAVIKPMLEKDRKNR